MYRSCRKVTIYDFFSQYSFRVYSVMISICKLCCVWNFAMMNSAIKRFVHNLCCMYLWECCMYLWDYTTKNPQHVCSWRYNSSTIGLQKKKKNSFTREMYLRWYKGRGWCQLSKWCVIGWNATLRSLWHVPKAPSLSGVDCLSCWTFFHPSPQSLTTNNAGLMSWSKLY